MSLTTYRLPDELGGGEHEEYRHVSGGTEAPTGTVAFLVHGCLVCVAVALLTAVKPPLPEEPELGAVELDRYGNAWQHVNSNSSRGDWYCTVDDLGAEWEELNGEYGPLVRLVPAPESVDLPWEHLTEDEDHIEVRTFPGQRVRLQMEVDDTGRIYDAPLHDTGGRRLRGWANLPPDNVRELARALWTAADEAEATP